MGTRTRKSHTPSLAKSSAVKPAEAGKRAPTQLGVRQAVQGRKLPSNAELTSTANTHITALLPLTIQSPRRSEHDVLQAEIEANVTVQRSPTELRLKT